MVCASNKPGHDETMKLYERHSLTGVSDEQLDNPLSRRVSTALFLLEYFLKKTKQIACDYSPKRSSKYLDGLSGEV